MNTEENKEAPADLSVAHLHVAIGEDLDKLAGWLRTSRTPGEADAALRARLLIAAQGALTGRAVTAIVDTHGPAMRILNEDEWELIHATWKRHHFAHLIGQPQTLVIDSYAALEERLVQQGFTVTPVDCAEEPGNPGPTKPRKQKAQWKRERNPFGRR